MSRGLESLGEGIATANPELKHVGQDNLALATVTIAFNRSVKNGNGDGFRRETTFMQVQCWGKMAERLAAQVQKGSLVHVRGIVIQQNWEKDGQKRSTFRISLDDFHVCVKQPGNGNGNGNGNGHAEPPANNGAANNGAGTQAPPSNAQPPVEDNAPPVNAPQEEDLPF